MEGLPEVKNDQLVGKNRNRCNHKKWMSLIESHGVRDLRLGLPPLEILNRVFSDLRLYLGSDGNPGESPPGGQHGGGVSGLPPSTSGQFLKKNIKLRSNMSRPKIAKQRRRELLLLDHKHFWNFLFQQVRSGQNLPGLTKVLNISYNAVTRRINTSVRLRKRYEKARQMQLARIGQNWVQTEEEIMLDIQEAGAALRAFKEWMASQDPREESSEEEDDRFQDLRERMNSKKSS